MTQEEKTKDNNQTLLTGGNDGTTVLDTTYSLEFDDFDWDEGRTLPIGVHFMAYTTYKTGLVLIGGTTRSFIREPSFIFIANPLLFFVGSTANSPNSRDAIVLPGGDSSYWYLERDILRAGLGPPPLSLREAFVTGDRL